MKNMRVIHEHSGIIDSETILCEDSQPFLTYIRTGKGQAQTEDSLIDYTSQNLLYSINGTITLIPSIKTEYVFLLLEDFPIKQDLYNPIVNDALKCIREDYAFLNGIDDLADRVGVSKSYLIRIFSQEIGMTPGKYLQDIRLENAMLLLQTSEYNIEMIAGMCGFSGANYFCKVFRRAIGQSPGKFRQSTPLNPEKINFNGLEREFL